MLIILNLNNMSEAIPDRTTYSLAVSYASGTRSESRGENFTLDEVIDAARKQIKLKGFDCGLAYTAPVIHIEVHDPRDSRSGLRNGAFPRGSVNNAQLDTWSTRERIRAIQGQ